MEPFNPACCLLGAGKCPFPVTPAAHPGGSPVGRQKTFMCPDGSSYRCAPGSERGCTEDLNPACCPGPGKSTKACPFPVSGGPHPPLEPKVEVELCACVGADICDLLEDTCAKDSSNPMCAKAIPLCAHRKKE